MAFKGPDAMERHGVSWGISPKGELPAYVVTENMKRVHGGTITVVAIEKKEVVYFSFLCCFYVCLTV